MMKSDFNEDPSLLENVVPPVPLKDSQPSFDTNILKEYILKLTPALLGGDGTDDNILSIFVLPDATEKCKQYATDSQSSVLYVVKERESIQLSEELLEKPVQGVTYSVQLDLSWSQILMGAIAIIKSVPLLDPHIPLAQQIQVINLPGPAIKKSLESQDKTAKEIENFDSEIPNNYDSQSSPSQSFELESQTPYEALHSIIHYGLAPYFNSFIEARQKDQKLTSEFSSISHKRDLKDSDSGLPLAKKRMAEFELALLQLQQHTEIPEPNFVINSVVTKEIELARVEGRSPTINSIDPSLFSDSIFLNRIQADVNSWIKEIQKITRLSIDPSTKTTSQEINFWVNMERSLEKIEAFLNSDQVSLTLDILKSAKRFHATVSFMADTGLKETMDLVSKYNVLMRDLPINVLLSATDIVKVSESIDMIFSHINKKLRITPYPVKRALSLVEMISVDFKNQLLKILGGRKLMYIDINLFNDLLNGAELAFSTWDENLKDFVNMARDVTRKRNDKFIPIKVVSTHSSLQERLTAISKFRRQHEQFNQTIHKVIKLDNAKNVGSSGAFLAVTMRFGDSDPLEAIKDAYDLIKYVDVLDVSRDGDSEWEQAQAMYNERIARIENSIISYLHDCLGLCSNGSEMFRVFARFNALFFRPKIRGAVQEYQTQLISSVKDDIRRLHEKFTKRFVKSSAYRMSQLRDIPPASSAIIWTREIENKLDHYMKKVEAVLGTGWELYAEGQKLKADSESFRQKLDTRHLYDAWYYKISRSNLSVTGRVFYITRQRASSQNLQLSVQFDAQLITLFKEVRGLLWLGFQVPHTLVNVARDGKRVYPFAVSLSESIRVYRQTLETLKKNASIIALATGYRDEIQKLIESGFSLKWDIFVNTLDFSSISSPVGREQRHLTFVRSLSIVASKFQEKVEHIVGANNAINQLVNELISCDYNEVAFSNIIKGIQENIDRISLSNATNLAQWVKDLDERIEAILSVRAEQSLKIWVNEFLRDSSKNGDSDSVYKTGMAKSKNSSNFAGSSDENSNSLSGQNRFVTIKLQIHELRLINQQMYLEPPLEAARTSWIKQLHDYLSIVCLLPRPSASSYAGNSTDSKGNLFEKEANYLEGAGEVDAFFDINLASAGNSKIRPPKDHTYRNILSKLPNDILLNTYSIIESKIQSASEYVDTWLQYQALWDLNIEKISEFLGDDLEKWQLILLEIKKSRKTIDNINSSKSIGANLIINFDQVQNKVNSKYDFWQSEILNRFGSKLEVATQENYNSINKARKNLEKYSSDTANTSQAVSFITFMEELKQTHPVWKNFVESISKKGQKLLERHRFQFPADWVSYERLLSEWSAFNEILKKKVKIIEEQISGLRFKISSEDKAINNKIQQLQEDWDNSKPSEGKIDPKMALDTLAQFEASMVSLTEEADKVGQAKVALGLPHSSQDLLKPYLEELVDLKTVWLSLSSIWSSVDELKDMPWVSVVPRKLRSILEGLQSNSKNMPDKVRQYAAFAYMVNYLQGLSKQITIISDLKSDAMRDRHWRKLFKELKILPKSQSELTLGYIWSFDLTKNESIIKDVIMTAQGEMGLEEFLKQVKETWTTYALDLVSYQGRCRLIKGWDDLFNKCSEHLSALGSMKLSPYYKVFEEEAMSWEDKLTRVHLLFDVWIDVQRQWVYLEGIFNNSAEIKHLLPVETSRFQNINTEFLAVMKRVYKSPYALDVLNLPNIQKSLERLLDLLSKIQKALGEYLEKERTSFPRFYFVGDEDLLEIIGNSKDIIRIQKHVGKMFSGIGSFELDTDGTTIIGMISPQGEHVKLNRAIPTSKYSKINEWLLGVENEMKLTLSENLLDAVKSSDYILAAEETLTGSELDKWVDDTPAQLVILACQIKWTKLVEDALVSNSPGSELQSVLGRINVSLNSLADRVLNDLPFISRKKVSNLITELVHQRDTTRELIERDVQDNQNFAWIKQMRFYLSDDDSLDNMSKMSIQIANATFGYGFEYLGVLDRLVQTPLTDNCFLTLTQALNSRLGGSPFGPAGTGKTETVKALGAQLGRIVLVFCCDESFDFQALGRIFTGLCLLGAYGCFDEFNRLEERILSAVSQQIQSIQLGLKKIGKLTPSTKTNKITVELVGRTIELHSETGIFITMNPNYAGRSNLPDNLKKLFRSICMTKPDDQLIAEVMLYSQGFRSAELMSKKIVPLFKLCSEQLSAQPHYDFGLRALKSVLVSAGNIKRDRVLYPGAKAELNSSDELGILVQSIHENILPKLVASDISLLETLLEGLFPGIVSQQSSNPSLLSAIEEVCKEQHLVISKQWIQKIIQLYHIQKTSHGIMIVGPSGSGKSSAWKVLLDALEKTNISDGFNLKQPEKVESMYYIIDPKAVSKDDLYGTLDLTTREWTDGLFTQILRKIVDNDRGESLKRHWIVFDGDVDPEWVENLNSVLDDNKLLTLPNGERLSLPQNVRIIFEVETLKFATPATVSRCGMAGVLINE
ncbi:hypothetical protein BB560_001375 [Smittium megazygosporum]|uniref:Dynein heavy chain, cytosolic n=1 Tax=Smittium megazygosporum TaxID=133381 RepID=A0A2T9ZHR3_9FUNG|nr:hypothetical protein BB560_001375 [Smittium megazygosporum]